MKQIRCALIVALLVLLPIASQATYVQQYALATDSVFQQQVLVAMLQTSANIMTENTNIVGHTQRAQFATRVIQNPSIWQPILSFLIASQANNPMTPLTVPSTVADSLVQTAMDAQWSNVSGYFKQ